LHIDEFLDGITKMWNMPESELYIMTENPDTPIGQKILAKVLHTAYKEADQHRMNAILDRFFGKPKEIISNSFEQDVEVTLNWGSGSEDEESGA
jgi:hypothetical protein